MTLDKTAQNLYNLMVSAYFNTSLSVFLVVCPLLTNIIKMKGYVILELAIHLKMFLKLFSLIFF